MRLIQKKPIAYQPVPGVTTNTIREFQGVNTFDSLSIADNFFSDMKNMTTDDYPAMSVRPGYTVLGAAIGSVLGLGVWKDTELHAVFSDGSWRKWDGAAWISLKTGLDTSAAWSFTNFKGSFTGINLVGCNGVDGLHRYDGSTVQTFGDADSSINYVTTYQNRLWGAWGKELHACALDRPEQWQDFPGTEEDSYFKVMEPEDGEDINMLSGGLSKLVIGFPNSIWELYGGVPSDFNTQLVTKDEGTLNNQSAVTQEGVMRFIHETGIYEYSGGILPEKEFSEIVGGYLDTISNAVAGSDGRKIYFRVGSDILVYDPRSGIQSWVVWGDITPTCFAVMDDTLYIGDDQGRVLKMGGDDDNGAPINWYAVTKPFNNRSLAQKLRWFKMWLTVDLAAGSTLKVYLSNAAAGDNWTEDTPFMSGKRVIIPVSSMANEDMIRLKIEGTGQATLRDITYEQRALPLV